MWVYEKIYLGVTNKLKFKKGVATVKRLRNTGIEDLWGTAAIFDFAGVCTLGIIHHII